MTNFADNYTEKILGNLHNKYDKVMILKLFIDTDDVVLKNKYLEASEKHNNKLFNNQTYIDAGFDLFAPRSGNTDTIVVYNNGCYEPIDENKLIFVGHNNNKTTTPSNKLDFKVCCSATIHTNTKKIHNTGYYMYPRSSLSKTQLRLANSVGIIDAGYRGHLIGMFDVINDTYYSGNIFDRYVQICAPGLVPIIVEIVNSLEQLGEETERGDKGFGSSGR